jgi:hypothetical protein
MYFTKEERKWLKTMSKLCQSNDWKKIRLDNLFKSVFNRTIDLNKFFPCFSLREGESNDSSQKKEYAKAVREGYFPVAKFVYMLNYLEKNHLILFIPEFKTDCANMEIEDCEQPNESVEETVEPHLYFNIEENTIVKFFKKNINKFVVFSEDLIHLIKNKFVSDEEIRFKKQYCATWVTIIIALLIGLAGIIINIILFIINLLCR